MSGRLLCRGRVPGGGWELREPTRPEAEHRSRRQGQSVQVEGEGMPVTGEAVSLGVVEGRV